MFNLSCRAACCPAELHVVLQSCMLSCRAACCPAELRVVLQSCVLSCRAAWCPAELHVCCFSPCLPRTAHATRKYVLDDSPTVKALRRQCHCAAYNLLAAVISCTQSKMEFYNVFLFKEDVLKVRGGASDRRGGGALLQNAVDVYVSVVHFLQKHSVIVGQCAL